MITITLQPSPELLDVMTRCADALEDLVRIHADHAHAPRVPETPSFAGAPVPVQAAPAGEARAAILDVSSSTAQPARVPSKDTALAAASSPGRVRTTPERKAVVGRMWPAGEPAATVLAAVNALPGPAVANVIELGKMAAYWGFKRPPGFRGSLRANPPPAAAQAAAALPATPQPAVDADIEQVRSWAAQRGLTFAGPADMDVINRKRIELGLGVFNLIRRRAQAA